MQTLKLILEPQTAFGTPLVGDTFFGQICWAIVERYGEARLQTLLQGYTQANPFLVVSDAFPQGYLPLPTLPSTYWQHEGDIDRKLLKRRKWLAESDLSHPSHIWQQHAKSDAEIAQALQSSASQPHNTINRQTRTTGTGQFAPYESEQIWYATGSRWQMFILLNEALLRREELETVVRTMGQMGYGRDASIGLGKYHLHALTESPLPSEGNSCFTLAPSCPQGQGFDRQYSFYNTLTRFGRHGNTQATSGQPFKNPVLMAQTSAVFFGERHGKPYIGQGIGGISKSLPATVHQGYAPVVAFTLDTDALNNKEIA